MSTKRQEEKNEKIIRGLMKLPPNRRCINCNSLGPQYVCTNFWTFVCLICSGIHREFTHRVKSISMSKFSSQEVDALQKGGNQHARELFLKTWDPQKQILPDNSNADKVREFIKKVYVEKRHIIDNSSNLPQGDSQNHRDETRRASSYHSYSQSPPYDFQYEERRYGKNIASLTRKPGLERGLSERKLPRLLSPNRLSSYPRVSDYSLSSGGDQFRSDGLSPSSQREIGSPFSETSSYFSASDGNKRIESSDSFGSFDSMSFKSVNSAGSGAVEQSSDMFHNKSPPSPSQSQSQSQSQSSTPSPFNGMDLFSEPQNVALSHQEPVPDVAMPNNGGWATFDAPMDLVQSSNQNNLNPFSVDQISSNPNLSSYHKPSSSSSSMHTIWHDGPQKVETSTHNATLWEEFKDYPGGQQPIERLSWNMNRDPVVEFSGVNNSCGYKDNDGNIKTGGEIGPPLSSCLYSNFGMAMSDFSTSSGVHSVAKGSSSSNNPFDFPCDGIMESRNMNPFWDNNHMPAAHESWFSPNYGYVPGGAAATFDHPSAAATTATASLGFLVSTTQLSTARESHATSTTTSIGTNPFA